MRTLRAIPRYLLTWLFLATGIGKLMDIRGFATILATYRLGIADSLLLPLAFAIGLVELLIGWNLLRGYRPGLQIVLTFVFHLGYALLTTLTLWRGIALVNCGCFGVFWARPLRWFTPLEDLALAALSLAAWRLSTAAPDKQET